MNRYSFLLPLLLSLTGCASIVSGNHESVSVDTTPVTGCNCKLTNNSGTWFIPTTPGSVMINRDYSDLVVSCNKDGYGNGTLAVKSKTKGMAFGNILAGGIIGAAVDMGTGAAYDYPSLITVQLNKIMQPLEPSNSATNNIKPALPRPKET